ncbi:fibronectin type III domain-containing protein [Micromonospora sp. WMMD882]|uniref:fibronectin type III domain-containing protein n=1 Tax=Micromonospora sp. WMMD882 TaxID=3015151 RepID=UPI00248ABB5B|nr:fibronectin type III domain-containing protein [Micromonospora sp. WMMD882]WBB82076.1 fibronectin type III domain-containing protein [Micromonospora sp. WMMD882]
MVTTTASARAPGGEAEPAPVAARAKPAPVVGSHSAADPARPTAAKPAAPKQPKVGKRGNLAAVTWKKPAENGSRITGYVVTPYRDGKARKATRFDASATSRAVRISPAGGAWTFTVAAVNGVGAGPASPRSKVAVPIALPAAPTIIALTAGTTSATLSWIRPADGGSPITQFVITPHINGVPQPEQVVGPATTGVVTGLTPATTYTFTVAARTAVGTGPESAPSDPVTIDVSPNVTYAGPEGTVNAAYLGNVLVTNGVPPYTYAVVPSPVTGALPPGLTLNPATGAITGIPTTAGVYPVIFRVTGSAGGVGSRLVVLTINARPDIVVPSLALGEVGAPYSQRLTVLGGTAPFTWSIASGTLPPGLTLDSTNGSLEGTPTTVGAFGTDIRVTDAAGASDVQQIRITVQARSVVALAVSDTSVSFADEVTFTVDIGPGEAQGSVSLFNTNAGGATRLLGNFPVVLNRATFSVRVPQFGTNNFQVRYEATNTNAVAFSNFVAVQATGVAGQAVITQFRQSGIGGPLDQYVTIYNTTVIPMPMSGIRVEAADGTVVTVPPTRLPLLPGQSFLVAAEDYSLGSIAAPDLPLAADPAAGDCTVVVGPVCSLGAVGGLRVRFPDTATPGTGTIADAAGSSPGFYRGSPLPAFTSPPAVENIFGRLRQAGEPLDTGNTANDFRFVTNTGGVQGGVPSAVGAGSPRNSVGPREVNSQIQTTLLDQDVAASAFPNREYVPPTPIRRGQLIIRRTLTNRASTPATQVKLRIASLSQLNGPPPPAGSSATPPFADLRWRNPALPTTSITLSDGRTVTVNNLTMDFPAQDPPGGGFYTEATLPLPLGGLPPGGKINFSLTFSVESPGAFWGAWDVLALGIDPPVTSTAAAAGRPQANGDSGVIPTRAVRPRQPHER